MHERHDAQPLIRQDSTTRDRRCTHPTAAMRWLTLLLVLGRGASWQLQTRAARCKPALRQSATRSPSSSSPRARLPTATTPWLRGLVCVARSFRSSRAPGSQPSEPTAGAAPFHGSQGCPSLACAAGFVQGGSCARVLVISWPRVPCLPPQLALYHDAKFVLTVLRTLNRSNFCHWSHAPRGRLRGPRDGAGAVLQFKFEKNRPSFVRT